MKFSYDKDFSSKTLGKGEKRETLTQRRMADIKKLPSHHITQKFRGLRYGPTHVFNWSNKSTGPQMQLFGHMEVQTYKQHMDSYYTRLFNSKRVVSQVEQLQVVLDRFKDEWERIPILLKNSEAVKEARKYPFRTLPIFSIFSL